VTARWLLAAAGAVALAWTVLTIEMPWLSTESAPAPVESAESPLEGAACPADARLANLDFTLPDINNRPTHLADFKGKVILLDFWATWCLPCKVEIPWFMEFQEKYGAEGLQVVGVSVDDTPEKLLPYVRAMKMSYVVLQGRGRDDIVDAYGPLIALPTTALISRDGRVCLKHTGLISKDALEEQIKALL
jgi:thiol-disulfide isomerase/thioredoxin